MIILGIETSCDETAAAIASGRGNKIEILSNIVSSQIDIHKKYGGVVPEVAAREHVLNILPVINEALAKAGIKRQQAPKKIDTLAVTIGSGLITSLQVGVETAKTLAYVWNLPIVGVNHIAGHIYANFISASSKFQVTNLKQVSNLKSQISNTINFPAVILTVSGGHTMLVLMKGQGRFKTIGQTRDDAAGEAFDKAAKLMGLGYPGGPAIAAQSEKEKRKKSPQSEIRNPKSEIILPRPMINSNNFDFSFSGLKTALRYALEKDKNWRERIPAYAREFQQAVIDVLIHKTIKATLKYNAKTIMLAGGVSANLELRKQFKKIIKERIPHSAFRIPDLSYTTDNAAMIAAAGFFQARRKQYTPWQKLKVDCNLNL